MTQTEPEDDPDPDARDLVAGGLRIALARGADGWPPVARLSADAAAAAGAVAAEVPVPEGAGLSILFGSDGEVGRLNLRWRGRDGPTNVLSFPAGPAAAGPPHLGDIVLADGVVGREAAQAGRPLEHHVRHLLVHGLLHLLGHDHGSDPQAEAMEALETRILARIGVPDPYSDPA